MDNNQTQHFSVVREELDVHMILERVYEALQQKGYNPVNQMVGYIMSGDPTYITSHNNARSIINKVERDDIIEALLENYIETRLKQRPWYYEKDIRVRLWDEDSRSGVK